MPGVLSPEQILKELAGLWTSMGKTGTEEGGAGVLRACSMTLVVLAEASEDMAVLGETVAALMPEHPARTIIIRLSGDGERALAERVYAQCWMPFGQRRQICCEQVEITASDAALADLPAVVLPLAVADLPVILWCRAARLLDMPEFEAIAAMAHKVVVDSSATPDARAALGRLERTARQVVLGDLAWTRVTRWREMLSQVFENRERLGQLPGVKRVRIGFGARYETAAWYLAAWISEGLRATGARAGIEVAADAGTPTIGVELEGEGLRVTLTRRDLTLIATVNDLSQCTNLPQPGDYLVMREELAIVRRDPIFERTLSSAVRLAYPTDR